MWRAFDRFSAVKPRSAFGRLGWGRRGGSEGRLRDEGVGLGSGGWTEPRAAMRIEARSLCCQRGRSQEAARSWYSGAVWDDALRALWGALRRGLLSSCRGLRRLSMEAFLDASPIVERVCCSPTRLLSPVPRALMPSST